MNLEINLNHFYSKTEIEDIFHTNFGARIKGITLRKWNGETPYIILFSRVDGPYTDKVSGYIFYYDGEGLEGDQKLTAANKALINANHSSVEIYGFRQEVAGDKSKYIGLLQILDYSEVQKNNRRVFEFKLRQKDIEDSGDIQKESTNLISQSISEPKLTEDRATSLTKTKPAKNQLCFRDLLAPLLCFS